MQFTELLGRLIVRTLDFELSSCLLSSTYWSADLVVRSPVYSPLQLHHLPGQAKAHIPLALHPIANYGLVYRFTAEHRTYQFRVTLVHQ